MHLRMPSIDRGVQSFLWAFVFFLVLYFGMVAVDVAQGDRVPRLARQRLPDLPVRPHARHLEPTGGCRLQRRLCAVRLVDEPPGELGPDRRFEPQSGRNPVLGRAERQAVAKQQVGPPPASPDG